VWPDLPSQRQGEISGEKRQIILRNLLGKVGAAWIACLRAGVAAPRFKGMSVLEAAEDLLARMSRAEKAQLLQWAARDLGDAFPGIESRPGVCGGEPCIVRTRIPVWVLEQARRLGTSEAELL